MKRHFICLMAFLALFGLMNCAVIEPAHAYKEDKAATCATDDSDGCFFCCSVYHQWLPSNPNAGIFISLAAVFFIPSVFSFAPDPPPGSIFRPPLAF